MKPERIALTGVAAALVAATVGILAPWLTLGVLDWHRAFELLLWGATALFTLTALTWVVLTYAVGANYDPPEAVHGGEDVQVRILTVDAADVVQATVDSLPAELDDVHVVAETDISVEGAAVHVVPDGFDCTAVRKGRAIEWARRTLACDREFVLYLDEDSHVESFDGLPDADVVQLRERPRRTGSVLSYLADVYRMGVQIEQRSFARLSIPLFAWGGGVAVRRSVEDRVTWDRETIVEDTAFVWAAAERIEEFTFELATATCRNEAPPSLTEITQQRRRWAAGNIEAATALPPRYQALTRVRNYAWALSPVVTLVVVPLSLLGVGVAGGGLLFAMSVALGLLTLFWYLRGVRYYDDDGLLALAVPLAPVVTVVHSMGTVAGILDPPEGFRVTEKVGGS
jgi:hypothetical protein